MAGATVPPAAGDMAATVPPAAVDMVEAAIVRVRRRLGRLLGEDKTFNRVEHAEHVEFLHDLHVLHG